MREIFMSTKTKEEALVDLEKFVKSVETWVTQQAAPALIMKIPDDWLPPNDNDDDVAFLLLDLRDPFAARMREALKDSVTSGPESGGTHATLGVGTRKNIELIWRIFRSEKLGELGTFRGWLPYDMPLVVISSGAIMQLPFGCARGVSSKKRGTKESSQPQGPAAPSAIPSAVDVYFRTFMSANRAQVDAALDLLLGRFRDDPEVIGNLGLLLAEGDHPIIDALPESYRPKETGQVVILPMGIDELRESLQKGFGIRPNWPERFPDGVFPGAACIQVQGKAHVRPFNIDRRGQRAHPSNTN
jgi:hypothetical protein